MGGTLESDGICKEGYGIGFPLGEDKLDVKLNKGPVLLEDPLGVCAVVVGPLVGLDCSNTDA